MLLGAQSIGFKECPVIIGTGNIVGTKEGEGPLRELFDVVGEDDYFGEQTWEAAESNLQKEAVTIALRKAGKKPEELRYLFAGDLLGQNIASSFGLESFQIPLFGLYGACSTCGEALSLASAMVSAYGGYAGAVTSSHFASAERQFRTPLEYASQRPLSATWTVTGSGAYVLGPWVKEHSNPKALAKISGITTGKIVDYGVKDAMNMGAAMAPAAADLIVANFKDFKRAPKDYDLIVTGDLGEVGKKIVIDLVRERGYDIEDKHRDCGMLMYDGEDQGTGSGGSGCGCAATVLSAFFLPRLQKGILKRILFIPTGALLSPISFNEGQSVPGIAHGVVIEHIGG